MSKILPQGKNMTKLQTGWQDKKFLSLNGCAVSMFISFYVSRLWFSGFLGLTFLSLGRKG